MDKEERTPGQDRVYVSRSRSHGSGNRRAKRRVSLGLKQTQRNPWEVFAETHPEGTEVEGEVKNITEFGLFVGLDGDIDGMVHLSDLTWEGRGEDVIGDYRKGDMVQANVPEVDVEKERISPLHQSAWTATSSQKQLAA